MVGRAVQIDEATAETLMKLVWVVVRRMGMRDNPSYDVEDLMNEALVKSLEAYPRWNPEHAGLSAFLTPRIIGAVKDFLRRLNGRQCCNVNFRIKPFSDIEGDQGLLCDTVEGPILDTIAQVEAREVLQHWAKERHISRTTMLILLCLLRKRNGKQGEGNESCISQIESSLRLRYGLENLYKTQGCQRTIIGDDSPISKNLRNLRKGRQ